MCNRKGALSGDFSKKNRYKVIVPEAKELSLGWRIQLKGFNLS